MLTWWRPRPSVGRVPRDPLPEWVLDYRRSLGDRIRTTRKDRNRTQRWLIERTGIDRSTYQRFESGLSDPHISDIALIAHFLDVDIGDLVRGQHWPPQLPTAAASGSPATHPKGGPR